MGNSRRDSEDYWLGVRDALRMIDSFLNWSRRHPDRAKTLDEFIEEGLLAAAKRCESCLSQELGLSFSQDDGHVTVTRGRGVLQAGEEVPVVFEDEPGPVPGPEPAVPPTTGRPISAGLPESVVAPPMHEDTLMAGHETPPSEGLLMGSPPAPPEMPEGMLGPELTAPPVVGESPETSGADRSPPAVYVERDTYPGVERSQLHATHGPSTSTAQPDADTDAYGPLLSDVPPSPSDTSGVPPEGPFGDEGVSGVEGARTIPATAEDQSDIPAEELPASGVPLFPEEPPGQATERMPWSHTTPGAESGPSFAGDDVTMSGSPASGLDTDNVPTADLVSHGATGSETALPTSGDEGLGMFPEWSSAPATGGQEEDTVGLGPPLELESPEDTDDARVILGPDHGADGAPTGTGHEGTAPSRGLLDDLTFEEPRDFSEEFELVEPRPLGVEPLRRDSEVPPFPLTGAGESVEGAPSPESTRPAGLEDETARVVDTTPVSEEDTDAGMFSVVAPPDTGPGDRDVTGPTGGEEVPRTTGAFTWRDYEEELSHVPEVPDEVSPEGRGAEEGPVPEAEAPSSPEAASAGRDHTAGPTTSRAWPAGPRRWSPYDEPSLSEEEGAGSGPSEPTDTPVEPPPPPPPESDESEEERKRRMRRLYLRF